METIRGYGTAEAARILGISQRTLEGYRTARSMADGRVGPPWSRLPSGRAFYTMEGLQAWAEPRRQRALDDIARQREVLARGS